jgi:hypothetical protein
VSLRCLTGLARAYAGNLAFRFEDRLDKEDKERKFRELREKGELVSQKLAKEADRILKPVDLEGADAEIVSGLTLQVCWLGSGAAPLLVNLGSIFLARLVKFANDCPPPCLQLVSHTRLAENIPEVLSVDPKDTLPHDTSCFAITASTSIRAVARSVLNVER